MAARELSRNQGLHRVLGRGTGGRAAQGGLGLEELCELVLGQPLRLMEFFFSCKAGPDHSPALRLVTAIIDVRK